MFPCETEITNGFSGPVPGGPLTAGRTCRCCLTGWETLCLAQQNTGYSVDGCYAEYFLADAGFATPVPAGIDPREAAPLTCAGVTTYKAVKVGNVRPGDLVLVCGIGGLGHLAQQYAKIFGLAVDERSFATADAGLRRGGRRPLGGAVRGRPDWVRRGEQATGPGRAA